MLAYFPQEVQDEIWTGSPDVLIATSLAFPAGRAKKVDGGYMVRGRWPLSSGVDNSDWNMLAVTVREADDGPAVDHRFVMVHRSQYEIIDTWYAMGLSGTGSKDVAIGSLFVPDYRTTAAMAMSGGPHVGSAANPAPLFQIPMLALGPYVLSGVLLGCALGAYEGCTTTARRRNGTTTGVPVGASQAIQVKVAEAAACIDAATLVMERNCQHAMEIAKTGVASSMEDKVRYRRDGAFSARLCLQAVDILMGVSGSSGLYNSGDMQRLFRDAHACMAHVMFSMDMQGALFGQRALGVAGPPPML